MSPGLLPCPITNSCAVAAHRDSDPGNEASPPHGLFAQSESQR